MNQSPRTIQQQIAILKSRGMAFSDENLATSYLTRISYFRLKYYWTDMIDVATGHFSDDASFDTVIQRYEFDKRLRSILFAAIKSEPMYLSLWPYMLRKNRTIDWNRREAERANMRRLVKRLLKKYKYPPEETEDAMNIVLKQCEQWAENQDIAWNTGRCVYSWVCFMLSKAA